MGSVPGSNERLDVVCPHHHVADEVVVRGEQDLKSRIGHDIGLQAVGTITRQHAISMCTEFMIA